MGTNDECGNVHICFIESLCFSSHTGKRLPRQLDTITWPHSTLVLGILFLYFEYHLPSLIACSVVWILFEWQWNGSKDKSFPEQTCHFIEKFMFCFFVRMAVSIQLAGKSKKATIFFFPSSIVWFYHQDTNRFTLWFWQAGFCSYTLLRMAVNRIHGSSMNSSNRYQKKKKG